MPETTKKRPSPIAASDRAKAILAKWARELGIQQIDLLDQFVLAGEQYIEHHGGRMLLPLKFTEAFRIVTLSLSNHVTLEEPPRSSKPRSTQSALSR